MTSEARRNELYNRASETLGPSAAETMMSVLPESTAATEASVQEVKADVAAFRVEVNERLDSMNDRFDRVYATIIVSGATVVAAFCASIITIIIRTG